MLEKLLIYAILVLVPMIPAVVLFGVLKSPWLKSTVLSTTTIKATIAGIPMELGGAIGGYFAVAAFFAYVVGPHLYPPTARFVHVRGTMQFVSGAAPTAPDIKCVLYPPDLEVRDGRNFDWLVPVVEGDQANVILQSAGYEGQTLYLTGELPFGAPHYKHHSDMDGNIIYDEPIVFQKVPAAVVEAGPSPSTGG
ncbi:MAG TPA: hypothetical protein VLC46_24675 [Thermoanaerobaculia bacterium]|jgi:hypothetical protein|nr:hypothetical protein [Thermoanaerobaculia bacterium]